MADVVVVLGKQLAVNVAMDVAVDVVVVLLVLIRFLDNVAGWLLCPTIKGAKLRITVT